LADLTRLSMNAWVVIGRAGMDLYADPPGTRVERAAAFAAHLGGSAANIAAGLVRLGGRAALVTRVSDDAVGRFVEGALDAHGIDRRHVGRARGEARTSLAVVETRDRDCQSVIYRNGAADLALDAGDVAGIGWASYGALVVTGTALAAAGSRGAVMAALAAARGAGLVTVIDVDYRPYSWPSAAVATEVNLAAARACDIVVGNDVEWAVLAGGGDGLALARACGAGIAVYKMGEKGAVTVTHQGEFATGIFPVRALKPTGAGDAFMAGFLAALSAGHSVAGAVTRGSAAAAIVVTRVGCAPAMPTPAELAEFLTTRGGPDAHPAP
jgi:5-dehydro-2-deoxygluconokinase